MSRRRQAFVKDNRAPVPSGAGMGAAAVTPPPSPVSREEEEAKAPIWHVVRTFDDGAGVTAEEVDGKIHIYLGGKPKVFCGAQTIQVFKPDGPPSAITPATDPKSNAPKKRGRPKGSKNKRSV